MVVMVVKNNPKWNETMWETSGGIPPPPHTDPTYPNPEGDHNHLKTSKNSTSRSHVGSADAVVHKSTRREGGQPGNGNAKKGIVLPGWLKLRTTDEILRFMRQILIPYTLSGQIGTRQSSAITTACKCLLDYDRLQELEERVEALEVSKRVKPN